LLTNKYRTEQWSKGNLLRSVNIILWFLLQMFLYSLWLSIRKFWGHRERCLW